jgi:hypothetical protein
MYTKLFTSLYQGTLRGKADPILVFTNMLAHADSTGVVDMHWQAIADETGVDIDRVKAAVEFLEAPDPDSRSPEEDGRRIVPIDEHRAWGWRIVNYGKYRAIRNEDDRREQNRLAQERFRSKQSKPPSAQAEAEAYNTETGDRPELGYPAQLLIDAFPDFNPTPGQLGQLEAGIGNTPIERQAWVSTVAKNLQKEQDGQNRSQSGGNRRQQSSGDIIANRPYRQGNSGGSAGGNG